VAKQRSVRYAWLRIKDDVQDKIDEGTFRPGDRIPTVAALAKRHGVTTTTVRQAINELASDGILQVRHGRGTTVAPPKRDYDPMKGFAEQARRLGGQPRTEIYQTQWLAPHGDTIRALGLRRNQTVWEVSRILYLDDEPVMLEVTEFPRKVAGRFMGETRKLHDLFATLREEFGDKKWHVEVNSVRLTRERTFSDILGIGRRTIFYWIERVIAVDAKPQLVSFLILRSDRFQLRFCVDGDGASTFQ
jgi:GntR family transcriptional regulator